MIDERILPDLLALSQQLNRQAFAQPPIEGWLGSFVSLLFERFPQVGGIHVVQVLGNTAIVQATGGRVPADSGEPLVLEGQSPVVQALHKREPFFAPDLRVYPILYGDETVGALVAYASSLPPALDEVLGALALQLGAAIMQQTPTTTSATGPLRRQLDLMRSLFQISRSVSTSLESKEVLKSATQKIVETLGTAHATVSLFDEKRAISELVAEFPDRGTVGQTRPINANPIAERMRTDPSPLIIPKVADAPELLGPVHTQLVKVGIQSMLIVPLVVRGGVIGLVTTEVLSAPRTFSEEEIEGVQAIAGQLAISVRNAQLFEELGHRADQLQLITDLSRRALATLDRDAILQIVAEQTLKLITADGVSVALRGADEPALYMYLLGGSTVPPPIEFIYEETALRFVCNSGEALLLDDISGSEYPDYRTLARHAPPDSWDAEPIMHAALIVPLLVSGRTIGTLNLTNKASGVYGSSDLAILEQIGNQLSIALENARLFEQAAGRVRTERLMNRLGTGLQQSDLQTMLLTTTQEIAEALGASKARLRLQAPTADPVNADKLRKLLFDSKFGSRLRPPGTPGKNNDSKES